MIALESLYAPFEMVSCHNAICTRRNTFVQLIPARAPPAARKGRTQKNGCDNLGRDSSGEASGLPHKSLQERMNAGQIIRDTPGSCFRRIVTVYRIVGVFRRTPHLAFFGRDLLGMPDQPGDSGPVPGNSSLYGNAVRVHLTIP